MRSVIFGGANSLDNFIARRDHAVDWLKFSDEAGKIMTETFGRIDTMLVGRKTYEVMAKGKPAGAMPGITGYLFSRTMKTAPEGVNLVSEDAGLFVRKLKEQPGRDIMVMGGGELGRALFEADVIDEVGFNIHPVLLGGGIPLFHPMDRQIDLELKECRPFSNGCVYVSYKVVHRSPKRARKASN